MNTSKGEQKIINILQRAGVDFLREYSPRDLKSLKGRRMRFDFIVLNNKEISYFIEFDGEQHFIYNKHFNKSKSDFKYKQEADVKKNNYCLARNYLLYRIPYYDLDKVNDLTDILQDKYLVKTIWHNHKIRQKLENNEII